MTLKAIGGFVLNFPAEPACIYLSILETSVLSASQHWKNQNNMCNLFKVSIKTSE